MKITLSKKLEHNNLESEDGLNVAEGVRNGQWPIHRKFSLAEALGTEQIKMNMYQDGELDLIRSQNFLN